jgi:hypothetical protein
MLYSFTRLRSRGRMETPGFQLRFACIIRAVPLAFCGAVLAQPIEKVADKSPKARTKPQVIYHLPSSSNYAATLHSQAKGQNNNPPAEGPPAPPQISRDTANAGTAQGRPETATPPSQEHRIQRSKPPSNRSARPQSVKTDGEGNSRPNKSHKK